MFQSTKQSLLQRTNKRHACKLFKYFKPEQILVDGVSRTRYVECDHERIDPRLKASIFSLSQSVSENRNLDPVGTLFSQTDEQLDSALSSYPSDFVLPSNDD